MEKTPKKEERLFNAKMEAAKKSLFSSGAAADSENDL